MGVLSTAAMNFDTCIALCVKCFRACDECFDACLHEPDLNERANCVKTLNDCSELCRLSASLMSRTSKYAKELCAVCARVCEECATECEMFDDLHCKECAKICRECAAECKQMSAA